MQPSRFIGLSLDCHWIAESIRKSGRSRDSEEECRKNGKDPQPGDGFVL